VTSPGSTLSIPAEAVPRRHFVDGAVEKIIRSNQLKEGMIVVCLRPDTPADERDIYWCRVEHVMREYDHLMFSCIYADGRRFTRHAREHLKWIVKKSSCP
jgi:hypothetical protein